MPNRLLSCTFLCCLVITANVQAQVVADTSISSAKSPTFSYVEHMPMAGYDIQTYLLQNMVYPEVSRKAGLEGRVLLKFIVTGTGDIDSVTVLKGFAPDCDSVALGVIKNMPKWQPGKKMANQLGFTSRFRSPLNWLMTKNCLTKKSNSAVSIIAYFPIPSNPFT